MSQLRTHFLFYWTAKKMSSNHLKLSLQLITHLDHNSPFHSNSIQPISHFKPFPFRTTTHSNLSAFLSNPLQKPKLLSLSSSIRCNLPNSTLPKSKEDAIHQAKTCLLTTLEKPLNNPKLTGKLKKLKQARFRVEIPIIDDSPSSLSELALDVFGEMALRRKGSKVKTLILWPNRTLTQAATDAFRLKSSNPADHIDVSSITDARNLSDADVAVFLAPEASHLEVMRAVTNGFYPRPVVIFNPKWSADVEESGIGEMSEFVGSFEVIYSFTGLEVRGLLSKRNAVVFKCVRDGVLSGAKWSVLVEEGADLKVVSRFKARPSVNEVENVMYSMMAINSPVTKSVQFLKDLVSSVTGKK